MARATPKLLDEDATEPDAPVEEAPVPGYSIAMARAKAMGEVAVDNGLRFDFSARDASRRSSFSASGGADNGILALQGPKAAAVLQKLVTEDLNQMGFMYAKPMEKAFTIGGSDANMANTSSGCHRPS